MCGAARQPFAEGGAKTRKCSPRLHWRIAHKHRFVSEWHWMLVNSTRSYDTNKRRNGRHIELSNRCAELSA